MRVSGTRPPAATALALLVAASLSAAPESGPVVEVTSSRLAGRSYTSPYAPISLAEQAASRPGVRLVRQGVGAPQADLRIQGGAFNSAGFAVEGLPLINPQTEHFHDLPIPPLWGGSVTLLTGLDQFRAYSGHASGSIDVELAEPDDHATWGLTAGDDGLWAPSMAAGWRRPTTAGKTRSGAVYAEYDRIDRTDGYSDNALSRWSGGAMVQSTDASLNSRATLLGALSTRHFGARGFYGAPPGFPAEEKLNESLLLGSLRTLDPERPGRITAAWQRSDDRYWLDRHDPDFYANHTVSDAYAVHADHAALFSPAFALRMRLDLNEERIDGEYTGRLPGTGLGEHARRRLGGALIPEWTIADVVVSAGGGGEWFDADTPAWLPAAQIAWTPAPPHTLHAGISGAVRQPSYTELNYESPGSLGNRNLKRQESLRGEAGWEYVENGFRIGAQLFTEHARRVVDWIQTEPDARWTAVNLGRVRAWGLLAHTSRVLGAHGRFHGEYMALDKHAEETVYASRYALDYARHEFRAGLRFSPVPNWRFGVWQTAGFQAANPARRSGSTRLESNLEAQYQLRRYGALFSAGVANPWDDDFETFPGQPAAGRQVYLSAAVVR